MATRNTRITALQIKDATITLAKLDAAVQASLGLADSAYQKPIDGIPSSDMTVAVQSSLGLADSALQSETDPVVGAITGIVKADGVGNIAAAVADTDYQSALPAGVDGKFLKFNTEGGLSWADPADTGFPKTDIIANEVPTGDINGANTDFVVANTPASGTLQVYLNGLLQEPGSGKDYQLSGTTITFATAPETGDIVLVNYCK